PWRSARIRGTSSARAGGPTPCTAWPAGGRRSAGSAAFAPRLSSAGARSTPSTHGWPGGSSTSTRETSRRRSGRVPGRAPAFHEIVAPAQARAAFASNHLCMEFGRLLAAIREDPRYRGQIVHEERFPARPARYGTLLRPLAAPLAQALAERGITRLYTHQTEALEAVRGG